MTSHCFSLYSIAFIVYTVLTLNIYGSIAAKEYTLVVIAANSSGHVVHYGECEARGAHFGPSVSDDDTIAGCPVAAFPRDGCSAVSPAPARNLSFYDCIGGYFAVVARGNCSFAKKVYEAQTAGYTGVIVYNYATDPDEMGPDMEYSKRVTVPAFMVGNDCGIALSDQYSYLNGFGFYIRVYVSYQDLLRYLVPFVAVIGGCFIVMLSAVVVKLIRDRRRKMRRRLSKKHLKRIPTRKFIAGDDPETCPICLDDFEIGDKLRVLPCAHTYHSNCIDPWLLKNRRVCPICKRKVFPKPGGAAHSDSDSDERAPANDAAGPSALPSTPERTPLLSHDGRTVTVGNSTFYGIYEGHDNDHGVDDRITITGSAIGSPSGRIRSIILSTATTPEPSTPDDPTVDVDHRQSLIPQLSVQSSMDECTQPGFITASSSFREGYANPNFVADPHELDVDVEIGIATASGTAARQSLHSDMI